MLYRIYRKLDRVVFNRWVERLLLASLAIILLLTVLRAIQYLAMV